MTPQRLQPPIPNATPPAPPALSGDTAFSLTQAAKSAVVIVGDSLNAKQTALGNYAAGTYRNEPLHLYDPDHPASLPIRALVDDKYQNLSDGQVRQNLDAASTGWGAGGALFKLLGYGAYISANVRSLWGPVAGEADAVHRYFLSRKIGFELAASAFYLTERVLALPLHAAVQEHDYGLALGLRVFMHGLSNVAWTAILCKSVFVLRDEIYQYARARETGGDYAINIANVQDALVNLPFAVTRFGLQTYALASGAFLALTLTAPERMSGFLSAHPGWRDAANRAVLALQTPGNSATPVSEMLYRWINNGIVIPDAAAVVMAVPCGLMAGLSILTNGFKIRNDWSELRRQTAAYGSASPEIKRQLVIDGLAAISSSSLTLGLMAACYPPSQPHGWMLFVLGHGLMVGEYLIGEKNAVRTLTGRAKQGAVNAARHLWDLGADTARRLRELPTAIRRPHDLRRETGSHDVTWHQRLARRIDAMNEKLADVLAELMEKRRRFAKPTWDRSREWRDTKLFFKEFFAQAGKGITAHSLPHRETGLGNG